MEVFRLIEPAEITSPIILSIPHCGTEIPADILTELKPEMLPPDDTDWFVDELYSFAKKLGVLVITSVVNRWVIDLNRNPDNSPLYNDGRVITDLCPCTDFLGRRIYKDERSQIAAGEVARRKTLYFNPYHLKLRETAEAIKRKFGKALIWDCHSIRRMVPSISENPFPSLILGSADGTSAPADVISTAFNGLSASNFELTQNYPFRGGYITREYGRPAQNIYALQLEMAKDIYMADNETVYSPQKAAIIQESLIKTLSDLNDLLNAD